MTEHTSDITIRQWRDERYRNNLVLQDDIIMDGECIGTIDPDYDLGKRYYATRFADNVSGEFPPVGDHEAWQRAVDWITRAR